MKRGLLFVLAFILCVSISACGGKKSAEPNETPSPQTESAVPDVSGKPAQESVSSSPTPAVAATLPPSSNHTVVEKEEAPKFYWALDKAYHLKDCKELEGKSFQEIPWDTLVQLGLGQCPVCNPPRYK